MDPNLLKDVILDQKASLQLPRQVVSREAMDDVVRHQKSPYIVVITGIRRCGKSTVLQLHREHSPHKDYYLNFDDDRLVNFVLDDFQKLYEVFIELYGSQDVFWFDEIQNVEQWERFVRRLHNAGKKIYITGSNATMFSEELGTRLTGRYVQMVMYPYSFLEYVGYQSEALLLQAHYTTQQKGKIKQLFAEYCEKGGLPEYVHVGQPDCLHFLYESILYRDIIVRYKITKEKALKELVFYLASNVGKMVSYNGLRKMLGFGSSTTVAEYCGYLESSFLCFFLNRYSHSLKKQLHYDKKVYFCDHVLAKAVGFRISEDRGKLLENIVFLDLKARYQEIFFHQEKKACDFVVREGTNIIAAIQVCLSLAAPDTAEREFNGLFEAMECYDLTQGYIFTQDEQKTLTQERQGKQYTIHILPVWQFLLQKTDLSQN